MHRLQAASEFVERPQREPHEHRHRGDQDEAERGERQRQQAQERLLRGGDLAAIGGGDDLQPDLALGRRDGDVLHHGEQPRLVRAVEIGDPAFAAGARVRHRQHEVPQRTRADPLPVRAADLPVAAAIGRVEARVRRHGVEHRFAVGVDPDLRGEKLDDLAEVVGGPAFDLAIEDAAQAEAGERQRQHDQHGGRGDEADEERVPSHAGSSGTR